MRSISEIEAHTQEQANELRIRLMAIPGVSDHTAAIIMAEIGTNVDAFENEQAIPAWAPSAMTARLRRESDLANFYYRLAGRLETAKAVITLAHKLLRIIYVMSRDGVEYDECKLKSRPFPLEQPTF